MNGLLTQAERDRLLVSTSTLTSALFRASNHVWPSEIESAYKDVMDVLSDFRKRAVA